MDNARQPAIPAQAIPDRSTIITDNRLPEQFRQIARIIWIVTFVEMVGLTLAGAGPQLSQLMAQGQAHQALLAAAGLSGRFATGVWFFWAILLLLVFTIPATIIYWRRQDDWTALVVSLTLLGVGCASTNFSDALRDQYAAQFPLLAIPVDFIRSVAEGLPVVVLINFPTGRAHPTWMRWFSLSMLLWALVRPFLAITPYGRTNWSPAFQTVFFLVTLGSAVGSQVYRYLRVSTPTQQQQTKWIMLGAGLAVIGLVALKGARAAVPGFNIPGTTTFEVWNLVDYSLYSLCILPLPVAFMFSILRYRLWDIDFIINRSLVYGGLTLLLAAVFGGSLWAVDALIFRLTGNSDIPTLGVIIAAVVVGLAFQPSLVRLRRFVDRHLYGIHIDYHHALGIKVARDHVARRTADTRTSFGPYTDVQLIGRGGMGEVYQGIHPTLRSHVAIKLLPEGMAADEYARKRFLREAQTIARLNHANIVGIRDYGEADGVPYMVMDFVAGLSLSDFMAERGPMPLPEAMISLEDIASALDYAHSEGVVHRDVKPSNVILQPVTQSPADMLRLYRAILMDFGIAKMVTDVTSHLTTTGMIGTIDYIAPEQIQGAATVTGQADIYSMGVMAYQMLAGRLPFNHGNPAAMLIAHLMEPPPDPTQFVPDIPEHACHALMRVLAKKPEDRYPTAGEFVRALKG